MRTAREIRAELKRRIESDDRYIVDLREHAERLKKEGDEKGYDYYMRAMYGQINAWADKKDLLEWAEDVKK